MDGQGKVIGSKAVDFSLKDENGKNWSLTETLSKKAVLLVFYPGDFTPVCTVQLCNYRDSIKDFEKFHVQVLGISKNSVDSHLQFSQRYKLSFPLLSDPEQGVAKAYGCTSWLLLGSVSRAVCVINKKGIISYRYVEPTTMTRRKSDELVSILTDLSTHSLI